jgi:hypothetical protein
MVQRYCIGTDEFDKEVRDAAEDLYEDPEGAVIAKPKIITVDDPISYVIDVILKEAKQKERLVKQFLYVMLSAKTNNPFNLAINAPIGEGKNWVLEKVAAVFPEEDVISLHAMTDKALFHESGDLIIKSTDIDFNGFPLKLDESETDNYGYYSLEYVEKQTDEQLDEIIERDGSDPNSESNRELRFEVESDKKHLQRFVKKLINLEHKILIFLDTPRISLFEALMPLSSHDKYESEYIFVDTNAGIKTYKNLLRGWPCFIFAQAIDYYYQRSTTSLSPIPEFRTSLTRFTNGIRIIFYQRINLGKFSAPKEHEIFLMITYCFASWAWVGMRKSFPEDSF